MSSRLRGPQRQSGLFGEFNFKKIPRCVQTVNLCVLYGSQNKQRLFPYIALTDWFLGAVAKFRRATISFVMSVRPSVFRMEQLGSHLKDFHEILYLNIFLKTESKFKFN